MLSRVYTIMLLAFIFMTGCSKEDEVTPAADKKPDVDVYMKATTGNKAWNATSVKSSRSSESEAYSIAILGQDEEGNIVTITFTQDINKPGKYQYAFKNAAGETPYSAYKDATSNTIYGAYSGTLEIQEYDLKQGIVKGTFEFTGMSAGGEQLPITKGEFQVVY